MDNFEMIKEKILKDKTWLGVIVLIFISPAFGFVALVGKLLYTIAISDMNKESNMDKPSNTGYYRSTTFGEMAVDEEKVMTTVNIIEEQRKLNDELIFDEPLKTITCSMCGTLNDIYKIDIFETPSCQKCGMLLLDRS